MADKKISALTAASLPLAGAEVLPIVQSGATVKVATDDLTVKNVRSNATTGLLQITGPGAGTTRVMTTPNANFTAARTDAAQSFTGAQSFGNNINLTDSTAATINFATLSSATTNYIQTYSDGYSMMLYVDRGASKPSYLMSFGGTHQWGFAGTSSMELDVTNKDLTLKTGNLVQGTAAKGINFTANTPLAGKTSQLLNWYEEGTWTPAPNSGTFSSATGRYTRIGRTVTLQFNITVGTGGGTNMTAPFTCAFNASAAVYTEGQTYPVGATSPQVLIGNGGTTINFVGVGTTLGFTSMTLTAGAVIIGCLTYTV